MNIITMIIIKNWIDSSTKSILFHSINQLSIPSYQFIACILILLRYIFMVYLKILQTWKSIIYCYLRILDTKVFAITMWNLIFDRLWKRKTVGIDQFGESVKYLRQTQAWPTNIQRSFLWKINIVEEKFIAQFRLIFEKGIA